MTLNFLYILSQFQTSLVGIIGFTGVIWTLRSNAKNTRVGHQREIDTRRRALRRLLAAEFRNYRDAMKQNLDAEQPENGNLTVGRIKRLFSEQLTADLGLLDLDEIDIVVNALITLDGMEVQLENISLGKTDICFVLPPESWQDFQLVNTKASKALDYAVQALDYSGEA